MKSKLFLALTLVFALAACNKSSNTTPGHLYVLVKNGTHFTGSYVNLVVAKPSNLNGQAYQVNHTTSSDTATLNMGEDFNNQVIPETYTLTVKSYRVSGSNAIAPVYSDSAVIQVASGQTSNITVNPH